MVWIEDPKKLSAWDVEFQERSKPKTDKFNIALAEGVIYSQGGGLPAGFDTAQGPAPVGKAKRVRAPAAKRAASPGLPGVVPEPPASSAGSKRSAAAVTDELPTGLGAWEGRSGAKAERQLELLRRMALLPPQDSPFATSFAPPQLATTTFGAGSSSVSPPKAISLAS